MTNSGLTLTASEIAHPNWESYVVQCDGTVFHCQSWGRISAAQNGTPLYLDWRDKSGEVVAVAIVYKKESAFPIIGRWNGQLHMESTPAVRVSSGASQHSIIALLCDFAKKVGCKSISMESHMGQEIAFEDLTVGRGTVVPRIEFRLSLLDDEDRIWSNFSKHHRRKINKAGRENMSVISSDSRDSVRTLRLLQKGSQSRRNDRGENMELGDDEPIVDFMAGILTEGIGKLYLVQDDAEVISGALISIYNGRVYYVFGGSNKQGFAQNAPGLLFWEMIRQCKLDGCREFNFGGVPGDARTPESDANGLYRFKTGFGGDEVDLHIISMNLRPLIAKISQLATSLLGRS